MLKVDMLKLKFSFYYISSYINLLLSFTKEVSKYKFSLKIIKICRAALYCYVTIN